MRKSDLITFAVFICAVAVMLVLHMPWRDEAQSWLIARDVQSFSELIRLAHYEGTPMLWHVLLMPFAKLGFPYAIQQVLNGVIMGVAAWILLTRAPFGRAVNALLLFGYFMVFEYGSISRSYSLTVLFLFLAAALYRNRFTYRKWYLFSIALLGISNLYGLAISAGLTLMSCIEAWHCKGAERVRRIGGSILVGAILLLALFISMPSDDVVVIGQRQPEMVAATPMLYPFFALGVGLFPLSNPVIDFWNHPLLFGMPWVAIILGIAAFLWLCTTITSNKSFVLFACTIPFLLSFFLITGFGSMRHFGLLYILVITYLWMRYDSERMSVCRKYIVVGIAALHVCVVLSIIPTVLTQPFSQSKALGDLLRGLGISERNSVLVSYPSAPASAVLPHIPDLFRSLYQLEAQRFGSFMLWDRAYAENSNLSEEEMVKRVRAIAGHQKGKEIFFLTSRDFKLSSAFLISFKYRGGTSDAIVRDEAYDLYSFHQP